MATYLICHGAWSAGWAWKKIRPLLAAAGHEVFTPTYTGLGERTTWRIRWSTWRPISRTSLR